VVLRKRLMRVFVFVEAIAIQEQQEAAEEVEAQVVAVAARDEAVMVVILKRVEQVREDRQVVRAVFVFDEAGKRFDGQQAVEEIGWARVELIDG